MYYINEISEADTRKTDVHDVWDDSDIQDSSEASIAIENQAMAEDDNLWQMSRAAADAYRRQDYREAVKLYEQLMELNGGGNSWFALQRGQCLFKLHRYHEALQQLEYAQNIGCDNSLLQYWLGKTWFELKRYPEAITALETMLTENPYHLRSRFLLLRSYQLSGHREAADAEYNYLVSLPQLAPEFRRHLGKIAYTLGDYETARNLLLEVMQTTSFCHAGNYHLMAQILIQLGENEQALEYLEAALQERRDGFLLKDYGVLLLQQKQYALAREIFLELEKERKYEATGRYYLALTAEGSGAYQEAAASYREVLRRNPKHLYAALKLANILERQKKLTEALKVLHDISIHQQGNTGLQSRIRNLEKDIADSKR